MPLPPLAIAIVDMMGYGPAPFHYLFSDDDLLSEGSSVGDVSTLDCPALQECTMADAPGQLPVLVETEDTHTPPDPRAHALANAQVHGEDIRQRRQRQPPPASVHPQRNSEWNARNAAGGTRACAHQVQQAIIADANGHPQFVRPGQNIAAAVMLLRNLHEPADP
jgi:hypothetical protein